MTEISLPWGGTTTGDATLAPYDNEEWSDVWRKLMDYDRVYMGVIRGYANELYYTIGANKVTIQTGAGMVDGKFYENDANLDVTIATPASATRIDRIVLRKSWSGQTVRITRIAGTEGAGVPAITQSDGATWDVYLYQVSITTGGVITVTDERTFVDSPFDPYPISLMGGRLTCSSTEPTADTSGSPATLYYLPYLGNKVTVRTSTGSWAKRMLPAAGISQTLAAINRFRLYDVFLYWTGSVLALELSAWKRLQAAAIPTVGAASTVTFSQDITSWVSPGDAVILDDGTNYEFVYVQSVSGPQMVCGISVTFTSAPYGNFSQRDVAITKVDGIYVKSDNYTRRYLGTIRGGSTAGTTQNSYNKRLVWNYYNRLPKPVYLSHDSLGSVAVTSATWVVVNATDTYISRFVEFVVGVVEDLFAYELFFQCTTSTSGARGNVGIGLNEGVTANLANVAQRYAYGMLNSATSWAFIPRATYHGGAHETATNRIKAGNNFLVHLAKASAATITFVGNSASNAVSGGMGTLFC